MPQPQITLEGYELPLREHVSPKGNKSYVLAPKGWSTGRAFRGVPIPKLREELPLQVMFGDTLVPLEQGRTETGNRKVSGSRVVEIDGEERVFTFQVSLTKKGEWWTIAKAIPQGGGGGIAAVSMDEF